MSNPLSCPCLQKKTIVSFIHNVNSRTSWSWHFILSTMSPSQQSTTRNGFFNESRPPWNRKVWSMEPFFTHVLTHSPTYLEAPNDTRKSADRPFSRGASFASNPAKSYLLQSSKIFKDSAPENASPSDEWTNQCSVSMEQEEWERMDGAAWTLYSSLDILPLNIHLKKHTLIVLTSISLFVHYEWQGYLLLQPKCFAEGGQWYWSSPVRRRTSGKQFVLLEINHTEWLPGQTSNAPYHKLKT